MTAGRSRRGPLTDAPPWSISSRNLPKDIQTSCLGPCGFRGAFVPDLLSSTSWPHSGHRRRHVHCRPCRRRTGCVVFLGGGPGSGCLRSAGWAAPHGPMPLPPNWRGIQVTPPLSRRSGRGEPRSLSRMGCWNGRWADVQRRVCNVTRRGSSWSGVPSQMAQYVGRGEDPAVKKRRGSVTQHASHARERKSASCSETTADSSRIGVSRGV